MLQKYYFFSGLGNNTFLESLSFPVLLSIPISFTSILSPTFKTVSTFSSLVQSTSEICKRPSFPGNVFHNSLVNFSDFRYCNNLSDSVFGCFYIFFIARNNINYTHVINFFNYNGCICGFLKFLNNFSTWSDNCSNKFFWNNDFFDPGKFG